MTYRVQAGDTLSGLALNTGTTVAELRRINCLTEDTIVVGQVLYLPLLSVRTPGATVTPPPQAGGGQLDPGGPSGAGPGGTNTNDNANGAPDDHSNDNPDDHGGGNDNEN